MCWAILEKIPCGKFNFFTPENSRQNKAPLLQILQNCFWSLENSRAINQVLWKFHTIFFLVTLRNSSNSWKFYMLFFRYPRKFHIPSPTACFFFWNCPLNTQVICIGCLRCQWHTAELFYYQWLGFHHVIWEGLFFFLIKISGLQQKAFPIFKQLNSTEGAYDNWKSYDWKLSILWFPWITTNKNGILPVLLRTEKSHYLVNCLHIFVHKMTE